MAKSNIPTVMRPVSGRQLTIDGQAGSKRTGGSASLKTNRGNSVEYRLIAGIIPPEQLIVRDNGYEFGDDGFNWIVNWATPKSDQTNPSPFLYARIEWGEGGSRQSLIVDAYPGFTMMIPSQSIDVFIGCSAAPGVNETVVINAQLHRSITSSQTDDAHRSFILNGNSATTTILIPPFANDFIVLGETTGAVGMYGAAARLSIEGNVVAKWSGPQLLANALVGNRILLPGGATKIVAASDAQLLPALLDFGIGL